MQINKSVNLGSYEEGIAMIKKIKGEKNTIRVNFSGSFDIVGKTESFRIDWVTEEDLGGGK